MPAGEMSVGSVSLLHGICLSWNAPPGTPLLGTARLGAPRLDALGYTSRMAELGTARTAELGRVRESGITEYPRRSLLGGGRFALGNRRCQLLINMPIPAVRVPLDQLLDDLHLVASLLL